LVWPLLYTEPWYLVLGHHVCNEIPTVKCALKNSRQADLLKNIPNMLV
jgi:hypothetical protein